ncbi:platelet glycoprotein Ib alpha chain [Salarias fasciatus]|uniref:Platelet glycoprotein Ib alpha chain-like n=1 Tax=Salarias fasciatus TaxID=181472 RepID=A0A672GFK7_SALFA|nr:platelet glycoprotein Ib alpha chain-like [Salarias fasciatus]
MRASLLLALTFLLSHVTGADPGPGCQTKRDKDYRPSMNCTAGGFSSIPLEIEPTIQVLLFRDNRFSSLSWSSFQVFAQLHEVDLTGNQILEVPLSPGALLPTLSVLRLGWNRLTGLPNGSFSACPALTELHLPHNTISALSDGSFSGLSRLETLDLTSNRITVLPPLMLHPLVAIENLFLGNNQIRVMPDDWFSKKEDIPYIILSANPWECSCSLRILHRYLQDNGLNVYVLDGGLISSDPESVVCQSPLTLKGLSVVNLEESELCGPRPRSLSRF